MRYIITMFLSALICALSLLYVKQSLTKDGEYQASLYFIGNNISHTHIVTHMKESNFVTHTYLKSASLSEAAIFLSKGYFTDDDADGNYTFRYTMEESNTPKILDPSKARFYIGMVGRVGLPLEESIRLIYHDKNVSIFDMKRNNNVIMYIKKH